MLEDSLRDQAEAFCALHEIALGECLGCGVHGSVWAVSGKHNPAAWALKMHREPEFYRRERDCYLRLKSQGAEQLLGFSIPQLLGHHDDRRVIEMTIVRPPFVLDFASAWLDQAPEFSPDAWEMWSAEKVEQFEEDWPKVKALLLALTHLGIYMTDVHPGNIMCR